MAEQTINQYTEDSAPTGDDFLLVWDVATGTTKKVSIISVLSVNGVISARKGGSGTNWAVAGSTDYDVSDVSTQLQCGVTGTDTGADTTVTFPNAYTQKPIVICSTFGGNSGGDSSLTQNAFAEATGAVTTTTVTFRTMNTSASQSNQAVAWLSAGQ